MLRISSKICHRMRLIVTFIFSIFIAQVSFSVVDKPLYTTEQSQIIELTNFDVNSENLIKKYLTSDHTNDINHIPFIFEVLSHIISDFNDSSQNHQNYSIVQSHMQLLVKALIPLKNKINGANLKLLLRSIHQSSIIFSEPLQKDITQLLESFGISERIKTPTEIKSLGGLVLNEVVQISLMDHITNGDNSFYGQESVYTQILNTMVRPSKKFPIIIEPTYSGKTEFLLDLTRKLMLRDFPLHPLFNKSFKNCLVIYFNFAQVKKNQIDELISEIRAYGAVEKKPLIVVLEGIHEIVKDGFTEVLDTINDKTNTNVHFIGTTTPEGYKLIEKHVSAELISLNLQTLNFKPLSLSDFTTVVRERLIKNPAISIELGAKFEEKAILKISKFVYEEKDKSLSLFLRAKRHIEDIVIDKISHNPELIEIIITPQDVQSYIGRISGIPFSIDDPKAAEIYYAELERKIGLEVVGQERMIKEVLDVHRDLLVQSNSKRPLRVVGITGPTGVGKTELAKVLAKHAYGSANNTLRIDGTAYMDKNNLWKLTGPTLGFKDSDEKGQLIEYLEGRGKNGGVILVDEGEKACPEFWQNLMSLFEDGFIIGGDGRPRFLNNHIVIITSNRGDKQLYPKGFESWSLDQQQKHINGFKQDQLKRLFTQPTGDSNDHLFPDYVIQRIDHFVAANQASLDMALMFLPRMVALMKENVFETYGRILEISPSLIENFTRSNFNAEAGYRPLFRSFEFNFNRMIQKGLAKMDATDLHLTISLGKSNSGKKVIVQYSEEAKELVFDFPSSKDESYTNDPQVMERLSQLPELIKTQLIGQNHIVDPLVAAVRNHILKSENSRQAPLAFFTVGPTGTGKTELAKVLALALFGSKERARILPMGEINSRTKWANFFGGDVGYEGGKVMRLFEQILRSNPQGAVIVLDEASNVGGQDKELKSELLKLLYNMIEEGKWISPSTGIEYDLTKYIFLLTGNDGQDLYANATDDHLRESIWSRNNKPERILEILKLGGVPGPLLGRMAALFWARPLSKPEMEIVTKKFLSDLEVSYNDRKIKIEYEQSFVTDLVAHGYSVMMGARSVRNFVEYAIGGLIAQIQLKAYKEKKSLVNSTVKLSFGDSKKRLSVINTKNTKNSEIILHGMVSSVEFTSFEETLNVKGFLAPHGNQSLKQAWETAIHEAGHAVVNDFAEVGLAISSITIDASGGHLGYVSFEENHHLSWDRRRVISKLASLFAGGLSQQMAGLNLDAGWSNDLEQARNFATNAIVKWGLGSDLKSIFFPNKNDGTPQINEDVLSMEVEKLMQEAYELSKETLANHWKLIHLTAKKLMKQYTISKEEWEALKLERMRGKVEYYRLNKNNIDIMAPKKIYSKKMSCAQSLQQ